MMKILTLYKDLSPLPCGSRWFVPYRIAPGVTAIFEPHHFQEVTSFLIEGSDAAILFDSGMGIDNIKAVVDEITDKPVTLVNSHSHFDHVGGNNLFGEAHLLNIPECVKLLEKGYSLSEDDENRSENALDPEFRGIIDLKSAFDISPCKVVPVNEGHLFDLGNRRLRVIAAPGHSRDSMVLADDENKLLFTGDTVYPGPLYAFLEGADQVPIYAATIKSLAAEFSDYTLCCSHNNPLWGGEALIRIADAFDAVLSSSAKGLPDGPYTRYSFGDFAIIM